jgi:hypothetical protein
MRCNYRLVHIRNALEHGPVFSLQHVLDAGFFVYILEIGARAE